MNIKEILEYNKPYNEDNLNELITKIKENKVVPYIGAGMSLICDDIYPLWSDFLNDVYGKYILNHDKTDFDNMDLEEKADFLHNEIGRVTFSKYLQSTFSEFKLNNHTSEIKHNSIYIIPKIFRNGLIITTNYDKVIEKVYSLYDNLTPSYVHVGHFEALNRSLADNNLCLYKIHGDVSEPATSMVLTKEQYEKVYENKDLTNSLCRLYQNKSMLFLGCSLNGDRPLEILKESCSDGISHFAIISCADSELKNKRLSLEKEYFTQSIIYPVGNHDCVKVILEYIAEEIQNHDNKIVDCTMFTDDWFVEQNERQISNLGDRYCPDLNVELKISQVFDGLNQNDDFTKRFLNKKNELIKIFYNLENSDFKKNTEELIKKLENCNINPVEIFPQSDLINIAQELLKTTNENIQQILDESQHIDPPKNIKNFLEDENISGFYNIKSNIEKFIKYLNSSEVNITQNPYVIIHGEGGIGKSHLIADIVTNRNKENQKSLLFLGQHFSEIKNPLISICEMLEIKFGSNAFLEGLNKIGEKEKSRIIIFIDALNEGNGKNIWHNHLAGMVNEMKKYPWLGLVVSIRKEYLKLLFSENSLLEKEFIDIKHRGFSEVEYKAIEKYFVFHNIEYINIPFIEHEFRKPLFLKILCKVYENSFIDLSGINIMDVYDKYLAQINSQLSKVFNYSSNLNIVKKILNELALLKYANNGNNFFDIDIVIKKISNIQSEYNIKGNLVDEIFSTELLTKNLDYKFNEFVYITYEKLEDYIYARLLVSELSISGIEAFRKKYSNITNYPDLLEVFTTVLSQKTNYELFDIFDENKDNIMYGFCSALKWRATSTITDNTLSYIKDRIISSKYEPLLFDNLIAISTNPNSKLNAEYSASYIMSFSMPDRDSLFIPLFDELYSTGSSLNDLIEWGLEKDSTVSDEVVWLAIRMLSTTLISSYRKLRDNATKSLINLLTGKIDLVIKLLNYYKNTDDPYILERLYCIAFGCIVNEEKIENIEKLAEYVYDEVFGEKYVYPNILLRDYAKNIIEFAKYKSSKSNILNMKIEIPFTSVFPSVPTDDEIETYKLDYIDSAFKPHWNGQNYILRSMQVEYTRDGRGGEYGDFGRYVFQSYFSNWKNLNYNDLQNIAIKRIFDIGYNVEKHGKYDVTIGTGRANSSQKERIGKKYQWIAFYELAAQISDKYKIEVPIDNYENLKCQYCTNSAEPYIRDIDPTVTFVQNNNENVKNIHNELYTFDDQTIETWSSTIEDLPQNENMTNINCFEKNHILLNGQYTWNNENSTRRMWTQINSLIVKNEDVDSIVEFLKNKDFMGRWLNEPSHNYNLYNKEYYWSDAYFYFDTTYYGGENWVELNNCIQESIEVKILVPTKLYITERDADNAYNYNNSWYKPCGELFEFLELQYGNDNSILYSNSGGIVCFDSKEALNEDIGFFIEQKALDEFLNKNNYSIIGTVLAEKQAITDYDFHRYNRPRVSSVYLYNGENTKEISHSRFKELR